MSRSVSASDPSARRIEANRRNARFSTGPRTALGKARSSRNALKHGLRSQAVLLPGEDEAQFRELRDQMLLSINPRNALELSLAEQVISDCWRIRRAWSAERNVYEQSPMLLRQLRTHARRTQAAGNGKQGRRGSVRGIQTNAERLVRLQWSRPHWEQEQLRENPQRLQPHVRRMWEHAQTAAADDPEGLAEEADPAGGCDVAMSLAAMIGADNGSLERLQRYEQRLEQSMHRCLGQLRKLREEQDDEEPTDLVSALLDQAEESDADAKMEQVEAETVQAENIEVAEVIEKEPQAEPEQPSVQREAAEELRQTKPISSDPPAEPAVTNVEVAEEIESSSPEDRVEPGEEGVIEAAEPPAGMM